MHEREYFYHIKIFGTIPLELLARDGQTEEQTDSSVIKYSFQEGRPYKGQLLNTELITR